MSRRVPRALLVLALLIPLVVAGTRTAASLVGVGCTGTHWVGAWMTAPSGATGVLDDQTFRTAVPLTVPGEAVRITLTNRFAREPVTFDEVHAALAAGGAAVIAGTVRPVTFGGALTVTIPPGREVVSDPVALTVRTGHRLSVSLHAVGRAVVTRHDHALQDSYLTPAGSGRHGSDLAALAFTERTPSWLGLLAVDVLAPRSIGAVAALGDSLTEGTGSSFGADRRWPDILGRRLGDSAAVLNAGISGNFAARRFVPDDHPLAPDMPLGAADRLAADVLARPGVTDLIVFVGLNDILFSFDPDPAASVIGGLERIARDARKAGLRVIGATLTPGSFEDAARESARQRVNSWIRTAGAFDHVVDFERAVIARDAAHRLRPPFDADGIHLNDDGYRALAGAVERKTLRGTGC